MPSVQMIALLAQSLISLLYQKGRFARWCCCEPLRAIDRPLATICVSSGGKEVSLAKSKKKKKQIQIGPWGYISAKGQMPKSSRRMSKSQEKKTPLLKSGRDLWVVYSVVLECLFARPNGEGLADEALSWWWWRKDLPLWVGVVKRKCRIKVQYRQKNRS